MKDQNEIDLDDFWDIDMITPKKKLTQAKDPAMSGYRKRDTDTVMITLSGEDDGDSRAEPIPKQQLPLQDSKEGDYTNGSKGESYNISTTARAKSIASNDPDSTIAIAEAFKSGANSGAEALTTDSNVDPKVGRTAASDIVPSAAGNVTGGAADDVTEVKANSVTEAEETTSIGESASIGETASDDNASETSDAPPVVKRERTRKVEFHPPHVGEHARQTANDKKLEELLSDGTIISKDDIIAEYHPDNPLICSVKIIKFEYKYTFYETFLSDAKKAHHMVGEETEFQPFFSYLPQYANLSYAQLKYYLWWRDNVRKSIFLKTTYSYIKLYIFEIINLTELIPKEEGIRLLCLIWKNYRAEYSKLDRDMCEWVCDYCLSNNIDPDIEIIGSFIPEFIDLCSLKELYLGLDDSPGSIYAKILYSGCNTYNFKRSRFITKENSHLFEKHIKNAFVYAMTKLENANNLISLPIGKDVVFKRSSLRSTFDSAVCAYNIKRRIQVEYLSCQKIIELRALATDTAKYAENQIRSLLGIRSRFHLPDLPDVVKRAVDEYFKPYTDRAKEKKKAGLLKVKEQELYEKSYDAEEIAFSPEYSRSIEEQSWAATSMLVCDDEEQKEPKDNNDRNDRNAQKERKDQKDLKDHKEQEAQDQRNAQNASGGAPGFGEYMSASKAEKAACDSAKTNGAKADNARVDSSRADSTGMPATDDISAADSISAQGDMPQPGNIPELDSTQGFDNAPGVGNMPRFDNMPELNNKQDNTPKLDGTQGLDSTPRLGSSPSSGADPNNSADHGDGDHIDSASNNSLCAADSAGDGDSAVLKALCALLKEDLSAFESIARESGMLVDALADMVNEAAYDIIGDIAIEDNGSGYRIIPDYLKELDEWICNQQSR